MEKVRNSAYNYSGNYYQMINQNQPNLANMKYTDPCFQDIPKSYDVNYQAGKVDFQFEKAGADLEKGNPQKGSYVQQPIPSASMVPQLWNPRHMLGFEEFKNFNQNLDFNDLAINLNDELDDLSAKSIPKPIQNPTVSSPASTDSSDIKPATGGHYQHGDVNSAPPKFDSKSVKAHQFTPEELVPQNMIRKAKKVLVPDDCKDAKYWARRMKNNAAAKRSREARHQKENQIRMRALHLEKENMDLRTELLDARHELSQLRELIRKKTGGCQDVVDVNMQINNSTNVSSPTRMSSVGSPNQSY